MQRVTSLLPSWNQTKTGGKKGFDKVWGWADKLGAPVNRLTNKIGSEAFWPMTLDKESDKAARILRSFCKDGFYAEEECPDQDGPRQKQKLLKKIPQKVIQDAVGLAIFTTMRSGLWISGAGGSGVLVARLDDGSWSPPSGILLHTAGLGFLVGVDIYDCVVVINSRKTLESFTRVRATLGGEISVAAGPMGIGGVLENDGKWAQANPPVFTYLKSRGFYAGVQVDGTVIIERSDENERFYHQNIGVAEIMAGKVRHIPCETKMLMETIKAAEGRQDVDAGMMEELEDQPAPGDVDIEAPSSSAPVFGVPEIDDPDPFGVLALETCGLEIREAGTHSRPDSGQFAYNPSPTSPIYSTFHRRSVDTVSNRASLMSMLTIGTSRNSIDRPMMTTGTQVTDDDLPLPSPRFNKDRSRRRSSMNGMSNPIAEETEEGRPFPGKLHVGLYRSGSSTNNSYSGSTVVTTAESSPAFDKDPVQEMADDKETSAEENDTEGTEDDEEYPYAYEEEEPVIYEAAELTSPSARVKSTSSTLTPQVVNVVSIAKRVPPALPARSPRRVEGIDAASGRSSDEEERERDAAPEKTAGDPGVDAVRPSGAAADDENELPPVSISMEEMVRRSFDAEESLGLRGEASDGSEAATPLPVVPGAW